MENTGLGSTLRETRNRRKVDLAEVEASTKIRARYLRALENEEWDVLPGDVYTRSFIRTYASYLGLDGERLADEHRRTVSPPADERARRPDSAAPSPVPGGGASLSRGTWVAIGSIALIVLLAVVALSSGGGSSSNTDPLVKHGHRGGAKGHHARAGGGQSVDQGVSVRLGATADVWVCLLDADGHPLVDGQILSTGTTEGPFHSGSFTVSFGNGEVSMRIDGQQANIPTTSSPVGYSIDSSGRLSPLPESQRPTCT